MQRGSSRKRNQRNKVVKELQGNVTQHSAAVQQREIRETKVGEEFQGNATQRGSARERNQRNKVD